MNFYIGYFTGSDLLTLLSFFSSLVW